MVAMMIELNARSEKGQNHRSRYTGKKFKMTCPDAPPAVKGRYHRVLAKPQSPLDTRQKALRKWGEWHDERDTKCHKESKRWLIFVWETQK